MDKSKGEPVISVKTKSKERVRKKYIILYSAPVCKRGLFTSSRCGFYFLFFYVYIFWRFLPEPKEPGAQIIQQGTKGHPLLRPDQGAEGAGEAEAAGEGDERSGETQVQVRSQLTRLSSAPRKRRNAPLNLHFLVFSVSDRDRDNRSERERIRLFREKEERKHLMKKRRWLEVVLLLPLLAFK